MMRDAQQSLYIGRISLHPIGYFYYPITLMTLARIIIMRANIIALCIYMYKLILFLCTCMYPLTSIKYLFVCFIYIFIMINYTFFVNL